MWEQSHKCDSRHFYTPMNFNVTCDTCFHPNLITVEHENLSAKQTAECLDRFCLSCASRPVRVSTETHVHTLGQSKVAFVRERSVHQFSSIALVFVRVVKFGVTHSDQTNFCNRKQLLVVILWTIELCDVQALTHNYIRCLQKQKDIINKRTISGEESVWRDKNKSLEQRKCIAPLFHSMLNVIVSW